MFESPISRTYIARKTQLGAHTVTQRDSGLPTHLRRLLLLADGHRGLTELAGLVPGRNVVADLGELAIRGLIEDASAAPNPQTVIEGGDERLAENWMVASNFMMNRAKENLGVMAADVIAELENARDPDSVRQAMSSWYRAMRNSRNGRDTADADRVHASMLLRQANRPQL